MNTSIAIPRQSPVVQKPKQPKQIGDFIIGKTLGEGTFGKVRLGTHKHTNQKVAIKILQKKKIIDIPDVERVARQIHILKLIRHPNLVQLYQIIETPKQLMLVMEYMQNGQLFDYIVKNKRIKEEEARKLFHELIDGIQYVKKLNIAHRDLKPENILLTYNNSLKIVDFGLSNTYKKGELLKTPCGSPCYAAPEMIQGEKYQGIKVDIWSSGIILFAMLNGYLPFEDQDTNALYKKVLSGTYEFHYSVSQQAKDLIKKILNNKPSQRYSIDQIREHPWMMKYKGKKTHQGIIVGYNKIPIDQQILKQLVKYGWSDSEYVRTCIEANRHNEATVTYHLAMKKFLREGGVSKYDLASDDFDKAMIQPIKRKDNTTETLIDNFLTKNSGSTDITQHAVEKRKPRLSRQKDQDKQNMGIYMNRKKSKDRGERKSKSKQKSKDNIKLVLRQDKFNTSHMISSTNGLKGSKMNQSVEKKSEGNIKRPKLVSSSTNMERKSKTNKLDCSINYGRVTLTKSVQKTSGRDSQPHSSSNQRESILENRVTRKYREQFNQSLISKSKGKLKTNTQRERERERSRINSSVNQSVNQCPTTYQGFNTTTITNTYSGHVLMNLSKKYKDHDISTGYVEQYLTRGKRTVQKKPNPSSNTKQSQDSSKIIKPRKL